LCVVYEIFKVRISFIRKCVSKKLNKNYNITELNLIKFLRITEIRFIPSLEVKCNSEGPELERLVLVGDGLLDAEEGSV